MGTEIKDWAAVEGAYYTGYGSGEMLWLIVAIAICLISLVIGARHELDAYKKLKK
ncbi:hypothetical protein [Pseudaestuariivita atlantica]|uniref:hypothetical protein n=1 Tax=Pseudaestuariivita atlantica TaxID=1317121 RepID=UPI0013F3DECD|nr:hypothetical protein [Pseudaestuariivita atlantica]